MKKLIVMLMLCFAVSAFAKVTNWNEAWNSENAADIEEWFTAKGYPRIINELKALIGKNANNITYDEYKKIIFNAIDSNTFNNKNSYKLYKYCDLCSCTIAINRFNAFIPNLIKDNSVDGLQDHINKNLLSKLYKYFGKDDFRSRFKKIIKLNNLTVYQNLISCYEKNIDDFTDAEIKEDMKAFKRVVYPKIGTSDAWKQLAVRIELLLKSVE